MKLKCLAATMTTVAFPSVAFAQSASPTFLHENRMGIAIIVCMYLAPSIIAFYRKHRSIGSIIAINILLGWTVIGWLWAFIKALGATKTDVVIVNASPVAVTSQNASTVNPVANKTISERIAELKAMLDAGTISESEFQLLKADAMKSLG